jgi:ribonuclease Y
MSSLLIAILTFTFGSGAGFFARKFYARYQLDTAESKVEKQIEEAKTKAREMLLDAKDKAVKGLEEVKKEEKKRREELRRMDQKLEEREKSLKNKYSQLEKEKNSQVSRDELQAIVREINSENPNPNKIKKCWCYKTSFFSGRQEGRLGATKIFS